MAKNMWSMLTYVKQILFFSTITGETFEVDHKLNCDDKCLNHLFRASAMASNMLQKTLWSLGLGGTTINARIRNILEIRTVSKNIYLDIFIVGNIQFPLKMSR